VPVAVLPSGVGELKSHKVMVSACSAKQAADKTNKVQSAFFISWIGVEDLFLCLVYDLSLGVEFARGFQDVAVPRL
jgi:hypothetical protein